MKKIICIFCLITFINLFVPAFAIQVPAGTRIPITLTQIQTSKTVIPGSAIEARINEDVVINGTVVFKQGDRALLNVLSRDKAGFIGIPGEMVVSGGKVYDAKGKEHRFDYNQQIVGKEKTYPKVLLGVSIFFLFPLALFGFVKGGQAELTPAQIIDVMLTSAFDF